MNSLVGFLRAGGIVSTHIGAELSGFVDGRARRHSRKGRGGKDIFFEPLDWEVQEPPEIPTSDATSGWDVSKRRCGVLAKKVGMIGVFNEWGEYLPLTLLQVDGCAVSQVKTNEKEGYSAMQVAARQQLARRMTKPAIKHFEAAGLPPLLKCSEFHCSPDAVVKPGTRIYAKHFVPGQYLDVQGVTIGKGFQGGMKKWGFGGQNASHGHSLSHRSIGATGAHQEPGKVWPGKKMPGRMGNKKRTVKNLRLWRVTPGLELLWVIGCVPGCKNNWLRVQDAKNKPFATVPPYPTWDPIQDPNIGLELTMKMPPPDEPESWFWKPALGDERKPIDEYDTMLRDEEISLMEGDRAYRDHRLEEIKSVKPGNLPWFFYEDRVNALNEVYDFDSLDKFLEGKLDIDQSRNLFKKYTEYRVNISGNRIVKATRTIEAESEGIADLN